MEIILLALELGAMAIGQGIMSEAGKDIYRSFKRKLQAIASTTEIDAVERNPKSQENAYLLLQHISSATQEEKQELVELAHKLLTVVEQNKLAQRDSKVDLIVERVFELFERHSIDRPTMAEILGVPLSTLKGYGLVDHLDNKKLDELAATFSVSREWLLGNVDYISDCACRWYKSPSTAIYRLVQLVVAEEKVSIYFIRSNKVDPEEVIRKEERDRLNVNMSGPSIKIAVVAKLIRKTSSGRSFNSYERWESLNWDYWKSRWCLLQLVMFCERISMHTPQGSPAVSDIAREVESQLVRIMYLSRKFSWHGWEVNDEELKDYERCVLMPGELILRSRHRAYGWNIDDYVDLPDWSATGKATLQEHNYIKKEYEDTLASFARWKEFGELIADV